MTDVTVATHHLPDLIRRTARLHMADLTPSAAHFMDCCADHLPDYPTNATDCLAMAVVEQLKHFRGLDPLDDDVIRDLARLFVKLSPFHPDAEAMTE